MVTQETLDSWFEDRFPLGNSTWNSNDVFTITFRGLGKQFKDFINTLEVEFNDPHTEEYEESN